LRNLQVSLDFNVSCGLQDFDEQSSDSWFERPYKSTEISILDQLVQCLYHACMVDISCTNLHLNLQYYNQMDE